MGQPDRYRHGRQTMVVAHLRVPDSASDLQTATADVRKGGPFGVQLERLTAVGDADEHTCIVEGHPDGHTVTDVAGLHRVAEQLGRHEFNITQLGLVRPISRQRGARHPPGHCTFPLVGCQLKSYGSPHRPSPMPRVVRCRARGHTPTPGRSISVRRSRRLRWPPGCLWEMTPERIHPIVGSPQPRRQANGRHEVGLFR